MNKKELSEAERFVNDLLAKFQRGKNVLTIEPDGRFFQVDVQLNGLTGSNLDVLQMVYLTLLALRAGPDLPRGVGNELAGAGRHLMNAIKKCNQALLATRHQRN